MRTTDMKHTLPIAQSESFLRALKQELILRSLLGRDGTRALGFLSPIDYEKRNPEATSSM